MPRPTKWGCIFNVLMLLAPFIGLFLGGGIGLVIGMVIACAGWIWFFFLRDRRLLHGMRCETCGRPVINLGRGTPFAESTNIGTLLDVDRMRAGLEGPGDECLRCGRIYCWNCAEDNMTCVCGSNNFRTVRLQYHR